ncbi:MAG: hypothetical protein VXW32_12055 [Myxococcota bacterium]|nr:hypothetical protein [Myxococcota bacterium]
MKFGTIGLLFVCSPSFAQEASSEASAQPLGSERSPVSSLEIHTDLHEEYLLGETMLVRIEVVNTHSSEGVQFPDLSARPWLVRFRVTDSEGKTQTRYNVAPEQEEQRTWKIPPRSRREVVLEIPSSSTFKQGQHTLQIEINGGPSARVLPVHSFTLSRSKPVGGEVGHDALAVARGGHQVLWTHDAQSGADLYLHHASGEAPSRTLGNYHLLHLEEPVEPVLALSSPQQVWDRHVYWMTSDRSLQFARLRGQAFRSSPRTLNFPYPRVELVGRGSTDGDGGLHIPFWIHAPNQNGGELRVASIDSRGRPRFRSVIRSASRPEWIRTGVDSTGGLRIMMGTQGELDLYTLDSTSDLPAAGVRVLPAEKGVVHAEIGFLPETESSPGGMALGIVTRGPSIEGVQSHEVRWVSTKGTELHTVGGFQLREGQALHSVVIQAEEFWGIIAESNGTHTLINTRGTQGTVPTGQLGTLVPVGESGVVLRRLKDGGPVGNFTP